MLPIKDFRCVYHLEGNYRWTLNSDDGCAAVSVKANNYRDRRDAVSDYQ